MPTEHLKRGLAQMEMHQKHTIQTRFQRRKKFSGTKKSDIKYLSNDLYMNYMLNEVLIFLLEWVK